MRYLLEPELEIQRAHAIHCFGCGRLDGLALGAQAGETERAFGTTGEAGPSCSGVDGWFVDVEHPSLATVG